MLIRSVVIFSFTTHLYTAKRFLFKMSFNGYTFVFQGREKNLLTEISLKKRQTAKTKQGFLLLGKIHSNISGRVYDIVVFIIAYMLFLILAYSDLDSNGQ